MSSSALAIGGIKKLKIPKLVHTFKNAEVVNVVQTNVVEETGTYAVNILQVKGTDGRNVLQARVVTKSMNFVIVNSGVDQLDKVEPSSMQGVELEGLDESTGMDQGLDAGLDLGSNTVVQPLFKNKDNGSSVSYGRRWKRLVKAGPSSMGLSIGSHSPIQKLLKTSFRIKKGRRSGSKSPVVVPSPRVEDLLGSSGSPIIMQFDIGRMV
ncbi:hypothetical protein ACOSQ3_015005 [Xanthoceras sorbifolium]